MDQLLERSVLFPKINESKCNFQRLQYGKQLSRDIVLQLKQNHSNSSYNLRQSKLQEQSLPVSLKKRSFQRKKIKIRKKLILPNSFETQRQSLQKRDQQITTIVEDNRTSRKLHASRYNIQDQDNEGSNKDIRPRLGQYHKAIIIHSPFNYKELKKRNEVIHQIKTSKRVLLSDGILNVQKLNNLSSRVLAVDKTPQQQRINRKPYFQKNTAVKSSNSKPSQQQITQIVGWNTEQYND